MWLLNECSGVYIHVCVCKCEGVVLNFSAWDEGIIKI